MIYYRWKINESMPGQNESLITGQRSNFNFFSLESQSRRWLTNPDIICKSQSRESSDLMYIFAALKNVLAFLLHALPTCGFVFICSLC